MGLGLTPQLDSTLRCSLQHLSARIQQPDSALLEDLYQSPAVCLYDLLVNDEGGGGEGGDVFPQEAHRVPTQTARF